MRLLYISVAITNVHVLMFQINFMITSCLASSKTRTTERRWTRILATLHECSFLFIHSYDLSPVPIPPSCSLNNP